MERKRSNKDERKFKEQEWYKVNPEEIAIFLKMDMQTFMYLKQKAFMEAIERSGVHNHINDETNEVLTIHLWEKFEQAKKDLQEIVFPRMTNQQIDNLKSKYKKHELELK